MNAKQKQERYKLIKLIATLVNNENKVKAELDKKWGEK